MEALIQELKEKIVDQLSLDDVSPDEIEADAPLFGEGLGLDSIDSLELIVLMNKEYGVKIENPEQGKEIFNSIKTMAEFIQANRK